MCLIPCIQASMLPRKWQGGCFLQTILWGGKALLLNRWSLLLKGLLYVQTSSWVCISTALVTNCAGCLISSHCQSILSHVIQLPPESPNQVSCWQRGRSLQPKERAGDQSSDRLPVTVTDQAPRTLSDFPCRSR